MAFLNYDPDVADKTLDYAEDYLDNALEAQRNAGNDLKGIGESVFSSQINNLANPQKSWLYKVQFYLAGNSNSVKAAVGEGDPEDVEEDLTSELTCAGSIMYPTMKMSMPKVENKTVERWYKGTKKTSVINQDRSGTSELEIQLRSDLGYNADLFSLIGCGSWQSTIEDSTWKHTEFTTAQKYELMDLTLMSDVGGEDSGVIRFFNPIIQNVSFTELSYTSSEVVSMHITVHYDWWEWIDR